MLKEEPNIMMNPRSQQYAQMKRKMAQMGFSNAAASDLPFPLSNELENSKKRKPCNPEGSDRSGSGGWGLYEYPLAMAYAPYQVWRNTYCEDNALSRGTLFAELDLPFEGCGN